MYFHLVTHRKFNTLTKSFTAQATVAHSGGRGQGAGGHATPAPWPVKNSHKKDDHHARRLIFRFSWPPLRRFWNRYWVKNSKYLKLQRYSDTKYVFQ